MYRRTGLLCLTVCGIIIEFDAEKINRMGHIENDNLSVPFGLQAALFGDPGQVGNFERQLVLIVVACDWFILLLF